MALALCLPAHAHTGSEIEAWLEDWRARVPADGLTLTDPLLAELTGFIARHPEYFDPEWSPTTNSGRSVANDSQSGSKYRGMGSNVEQWRDLVEAYFPADQVDTALRVMACESGGNEHARNPRSTATGLMQVLYSLWGPHYGLNSRSDLENPGLNMRLAADIWANYGWGAWTCF